MNLRTARLNAGLTVAQVMKALDVSDAAVYQWETGINHPSVKNLLKLAELYGVTVDELLKGESE